MFRFARFSNRSMARRLALALLILLTASCSVFGGNSTRDIRAVRVSQPPRLDGFLNDDVWKLAEPAADFIQRDPDEGKPASEPTEVRVLYDDDALYIGAMMYDAHPELIVARLTRRDNIVESDRFAVFLDSFHDHQTCYRFGINAAGVKVDVLHYDDGNREDQSWDAVWEVETQILPNGWSVEMRLPLRIFRYRSDAAEQTWGINFLRLITRRGERADWVYIPKRESGFVSRFGHLVGLKDLPSPRRLELLPFVVSKQDWQPERPSQRSVRTLSGDAGVDVKYSLSNNFLLDATINPDFGQVEADPSVLNLTTFETFYPEKRPFFIEGTQIIRFTTFGDDFGPGMFYSRRIGRALSASEVNVPPGGTILSLPQATTILGAAKLTGKTNSGLSVGVLQAFTAEMRARVADSTGATSEQVVEPFAHYNVVRLRQDVHENSVIGMIVTSTAKQHRLPGLTGGVDWNLKFDGNTYQFDGFLAASYTKNFSTARGLGSAGKAAFSRIAAEHWLWTVSVDFTSKEYNINDVGFFRRPNDYGVVGWITYKEDRPAEVVRNYRVSLFGHERRNFDEANLIREVNVSSTILFMNYWELEANAGINVGKYDDRETRGNGLYARPASYEVNIGAETDERRDAVVSLSWHTAWDARGRREWGPIASCSFRPVSWMEHTLSAGYNRVRNQEAWVENVDLPSGRSSIFADRSTDEVNITLRSTVTFTRDLTLQFYGQMFLAKGHFENPRRLIGTSAFEPYPSGPLPDFNAQALNTNLVLRWEYVPGSTLFLVWSHARHGGSNDYFRSFSENLRDMFRWPPANVLLLKVSYWWNV